MAAQTEVQMIDHLGSREWAEGTEDIGSRTQKKRRAPQPLDWGWSTDVAMGGRLASIISVEQEAGEREGWGTRRGLVFKTGEWSSHP